jgi:hypothetical protein
MNYAVHFLNTHESGSLWKHDDGYGRFLMLKRTVYGQYEYNDKERYHKSKSGTVVCIQTLSGSG